MSGTGIAGVVNVTHRVRITVKYSLKIHHVETQVYIVSRETAFGLLRLPYTPFYNLPMREVGKRVLRVNVCWYITASTLWVVTLNDEG